MAVMSLHWLVAASALLPAVSAGMGSGMGREQPNPPSPVQTARPRLEDAAVGLIPRVVVTARPAPRGLLQKRASNTCGYVDGDSSQQHHSPNPPSHQTTILTPHRLAVCLRRLKRRVYLRHRGVCDGLLPGHLMPNHHGMSPIHRVRRGVEHGYREDAVLVRRGPWESARGPGVETLTHGQLQLVRTGLRRFLLRRRQRYAVRLHHPNLRHCVEDLHHVLELIRQRRPIIELYLFPQQ